MRHNVSICFTPSLQRAPHVFLEALASAPQAVSFEVWWLSTVVLKDEGGTAVFPQFLLSFRWKKEWKMRMKSTSTLNLLGCHPGRRREVVTRFPRIPWCVFCLRPTFRAALRTRKSCKWQMRARPFKRCSTLAQQCIDVYLEEYKSSSYLIWQYISYDAYCRIYIS